MFYNLNYCHKPDTILYDYNPNALGVIVILSYVVSSKLILDTWDSFSKQTLMAT